jgi:hypothetical protein
MEFESAIFTTLHEAGLGQTLAKSSHFACYDTFSAHLLFRSSRPNRNFMRWMEARLETNWCWTDLSSHLISIVLSSGLFALSAL